MDNVITMDGQTGVWLGHLQSYSHSDTQWMWEAGDDEYSVDILYSCFINITCDSQGRLIITVSACLLVPGPAPAVAGVAH